MRLEGKVALVTGASGALGSAIAGELAREGADVAVHYAADAAGAAGVADRVSALGRVAVTVQADVADPGQVEDMVRHVVAEFGGLDILVNNAGILSFDAPWDDWDRVMAVNVKGPYLCATAAHPYLKPAGGVIINISSLSAYQGSGIYGVSKAALNALTRALALDLAPEVRVVGVAPGFIAAGMNDRRREIWDDMAHRTPLGRNGTPEEIARAVAFLASPDASFITGETLTVSGGRFMRP